MYEELNLKEWPFRVVPDKDFGKTWAGRKKTKEQLDRLLRKMSFTPKSSLQIMWANFGMGKTHTLYHIEYLCKTHFPQLLPVYAVLPKEPKGFLDVYRGIVSALPLNVLGDRLTAMGSVWPRDLRLHPLFEKNPDVASALLATFSQDEMKFITARQWLTAQTGLRQGALNEIGVTRTIRDAEDAVHALIILTRLMTSNPKSPTKVLVMIDEFQRIGELRESLRRAINVGLHTYFNANSTGLDIILSFSFGRAENVKFMLSDELRSRAQLQAINLDTLTEDEAVEFIGDLLSQFRLRETCNPYEPYSEAAVQAIVRHISQEKALTPRRLMHYFDHILQEWHIDHGANGEISAEDVERYLASPELGFQDSDTPDS